MLKVISVRLVILADQTPVPMLPLGVVGELVGFRITENTSDGPITLNFAARNGPGTEHVENAVTGVPYIVRLPVFGDEAAFITLSASGTLAAHVDFEFLIRE